ncbi:putative protein kinase YGL059W [Sarracenia purpurea var. burkii]
MAQVVATPPIHTSSVCPTSGSLQNQVEKIKPSGFSSTVLARQQRRSHRVLRISAPIAAMRSARAEPVVIPVSPEDVPKTEDQIQYLGGIQQLGDNSVSMWSKPIVRRKTKIVCTIGPSTDTREMIWKMAETGMNVARLNMSHGDHASHQKVIDLVKEYNAQSKDNVIAIMLDTKVGLFFLSVFIIFLLNSCTKFF